MSWHDPTKPHVGKCGQVKIKTKKGATNGEMQMCKM